MVSFDGIVLGGFDHLIPQTRPMKAKPVLSRTLRRASDRRLASIRARQLRFRISSSSWMKLILSSPSPAPRETPQAPSMNFAESSARCVRSTALQSCCPLSVVYLSAIHHRTRILRHVFMRDYITSYLRSVTWGLISSHHRFQHHRLWKLLLRSNISGG